MELQPISIGSSVPPPPFEGRVHSVFETSANLQVSGMDTLVTVYSSATTDLPQGIRLHPDNFSTHHLMAGQQVWAREGRLYMPGNVITLDGVRCWGAVDSRRVEKVHNVFDLSQPAVRNAWQRVHNELDCRQSAITQLPGGRLTRGRLAKALDLLENAARTCNASDAEKAAAQLVGLGVGLTPSGDDMLVGFCAGLQAACGDDPIRTDFLDLFSGILERISMLTNDISRTYLVLASRRQFSSSLSDLVQAICAGETGETLESAARAVFNTGHSSGCDTAAGMLSGLAAWSSE